MQPNQLDPAEIERRFGTAPKYVSHGGGVLNLVLDVHLTTLLYGGGPEAGWPDPITPFRPSSIRGQLRFWWRATRGAACKDWKELREKESKVWGDTDLRSPVRVRVAFTDKLKSPELLRLDSIPLDDPRRYALFPPYNEKNVDETRQRLQRGGGFQLTISLDASQRGLQPDVEAALWAWLNFGGLGARTRRGAGALYCPDYAGWDTKHLAGDDDGRPWPTMKGGILLSGAQKMNWDRCWQELLKFYRRFRQDRPVARGATLWPEPDEIRSIRIDRKDPSVNQGFPRGAVGTPIIFHFKDRCVPDQTLSPRDDDRMASPVILKPLAIDRTLALPVILILNTPPPGGLSLYEGLDRDRKRRNEVPVHGGLRNALSDLVSAAGAPPLNLPVVRL